MPFGKTLCRPTVLRTGAQPSSGGCVFEWVLRRITCSFLEAGLVKIERITEGNKEILLSVVAPGEIFGEQAITGEGVFNISAKVLESGIAYSIPTDTFQRYL